LRLLSFLPTSEPRTTGLEHSVGERDRRFLWEVVADAALDRPGGVDVAILTDPRGSVLPDPADRRP
jgi:hypothetical protein